RRGARVRRLQVALLHVAPRLCKVSSGALRNVEFPPRKIQLRLSRPRLVQSDGVLKKLDSFRKPSLREHRVPFLKQGIQLGLNGRTAQVLLQFLAELARAAADRVQLQRFL